MTDIDIPGRISFRDLGTALERDPSWLQKQSKKPGWPNDNDIGKVRIWIKRNTKERKPKDAKNIPLSFGGSDAGQPISGNIPTGVSEVKAPISSSDPLIQQMLDGGASPIDLLRIAMRMAGKEVAQAYQTNALTPSVLDSLKKTSSELRNAEMGYIELEKERGELIERAEVKQLIGDMVARLIRCFQVLENTLATEVSLWLAPESALAKMPQDERMRAVREFVAKACREVRVMESDGVDVLIKKHLDSASE